MASKLVSGTNTFTMIAAETIVAGNIVCITDGECDHSAGRPAGVALIGGVAGDPITVAGPGCIVKVTVDATGVTAADLVESSATGTAHTVVDATLAEVVNAAGKMLQTVAGNGAGEMQVM